MTPQRLQIAIDEWAFTRLPASETPLSEAPRTLRVEPLSINIYEWVRQ